MFFRDNGGGPWIYIVDVLGRSETLVPTPSYESDPAWGPLQD
jgi:TolB protein